MDQLHKMCDALTFTSIVVIYMREFLQVERQVMYVYNFPSGASCVCGGLLSVYSYYWLHGPWVCAVGSELRDSKNTIAERKFGTGGLEAARLKTGRAADEFSRARDVSCDVL